MILADHEIRALAQGGMITPFHDAQRGKDIISYGLSSFGYDARVDRQFKVFTRYEVVPDNFGGNIVIDPKNFNNCIFTEHEGDFCIIPPNGFVLARTMETFDIPRDVLAVCMGKSTYARCGIVTGCTPLEPEWRGMVTLEFSNTTPLPAKIYAGEGACQFLFFKGEGPCEVSYKDRKGKYQDQTEVTLPRILR